MEAYASSASELLPVVRVDMVRTALARASLTALATELAEGSFGEGME